MDSRVQAIIMRSEYLQEMMRNDVIVKINAETASSDVQFVESIVRSMRGALAMAHDAIVNQRPIMLMAKPSAAGEGG